MTWITDDMRGIVGKVMREALSYPIALSDITAVRTEAGEAVADLDLWMDDDTGARLSTGTATAAFPG